MPALRSRPTGVRGDSRSTARTCWIAGTGSRVMISAARARACSPTSARSASMVRRAPTRLRRNTISRERLMTWFQAPGATLPNLVALHGKWRGARTALIEGERRLTWRQFEQQTARAANGLRALGLRSGDRVAVLMDNSLEMAILLFGIMRYGGVAVPLNVSISDDAVARMIEDADARAIFASCRHYGRIDELGAKSKAVARAARVAMGHADSRWIEFNAWLDVQSPEWHRAIGPEQECNIIYSSGTTGSPKGI